MEKTTQILPSSVSALWAIDPTEDRLRPSSEALQNVRHFLGGDFLHVHPTYIYSDGQLSRERAQEKVREFLIPLQTGAMLPSEVYLSRSEKRSEWVDQILSLAQQRKDDIVILTSHGRSTLGSFFLGSFAKEIIQKSTLPILFMTHEKPVFAETEKVLFATDFTEGSENAFREFLKFVKGKASEIILCHVINFPSPGSPLEAMSGVGVSVPDYFVEEQKDWAAQKIHQWVAEARMADMQVKLQSIIEESMAGSSAAILEKTAKDGKAGLIGLASHVGPVERIVLGSVAQDLLASQKFNLWISGPRLGR